MPTFSNYKHFNRHHCETGFVHNHFTYRGITHPALLTWVLLPERIICLAIPPGRGGAIVAK